MIYGPGVLLVVFGLLLAALDIALVVLTPVLFRRLARVPPASRPTAIFLARFTPVLAALVLTALLFVPAWWRHEPANTGEIASPLLLALAGLALLPLLSGACRAAVMFVRTRDRISSWRDRGRNASCADTPFEVVEVKGADLALCVGGYLKPTIYASTDVMTSLEPEELSAALAHEASHARARDPLRLLWMGSCPDFLPLLRRDDAWRRAFAVACEFAADAGASRGNPEVALDLASALLKVARLRTFPQFGPATLADVAVSSAFSSRVDLEARVEALANPPTGASGAGFFLRPWMFVPVALVIGMVGAVESARVHSVSEALGRFLAP